MASYGVRCNVSANSPAAGCGGRAIDEMVELLKRYSKHGVSTSALMSRLAESAETRSGRAESELLGRQRAQKHTRLSPTQRDELVGLYVEGETTNGLARRFGVHKDTVRAIVDAAGVRRTHRHRMSQADDTRATEMRADGGSYAAIAAHFGVAPETVRRRLKMAVAAG